MSADIELLPCPFCAGMPVIEDHRLQWVVRCGCQACVLGERVPEPVGYVPDEFWASVRDSAVLAWNRRASAPVAQQFIAESKGLQADILTVMYKAAQRGDSVERMHAQICALLSAAPVAQQPVAGDEYEDCQRCAGSRVRGMCHGVVCPRCNGSATVRAALSAPVAQAGNAESLLSGINRTLTSLRDGWADRNDAAEAIAHIAEVKVILAAAPQDRAAPAAVPDGWQLVPKEPTIKMIAALGWGGDEDMAVGHGAISFSIENEYKAMLAAAPIPGDRRDPDRLVSPSGIFDRREE